ncbi:hypothetical protein [Actinophytocola oryzae]|uniref:hypothetical protein n=1 Tax=Actinophytocola oryzae TaxID=502181 RepID=UPI0010641FB3|nr:hypothetical protein [Actinophytocola oryzae]
MDVAKYAAAGAAFMGGLDIAIDGVQNTLHTAGGQRLREGVDWNAFFMSSVLGALGGGFFGVGRSIGRGLDIVSRGLRAGVAKEIEALAGREARAKAARGFRGFADLGYSGMQVGIGGAAANQAINVAQEPLAGALSRLFPPKDGASAESGAAMPLAAATDGALSLMSRAQGARVSTPNLSVGDLSLGDLSIGDLSIAEVGLGAEKSAGATDGVAPLVHSGANSVTAPVSTGPGAMDASEVRQGTQETEPPLMGVPAQAEVVPLARHGSLGDLVQQVGTEARKLATGEPPRIERAVVAARYGELTRILEDRQSDIGRVHSTVVAQWIAQYALTGERPHGLLGGAPATVSQQTVDVPDVVSTGPVREATGPWRPWQRNTVVDNWRDHVLTEHPSLPAELRADLVNADSAADLSGPGLAHLRTWITGMLGVHDLATGRDFGFAEVARMSGIATEAEVSEFWAEAAAAPVVEVVVGQPVVHDMAVRPVHALGPVPEDVRTWRQGALGARTWREYLTERDGTPDWLRSKLVTARTMNDIGRQAAPELDDWLNPWLLGMLEEHRVDRVTFRTGKVAVMSGLMTEPTLRRRWNSFTALADAVEAPLGPVPQDVLTWRPGAFGWRLDTWQEYVLARAGTPDWLRGVLRNVRKLNEVPPSVAAEIEKWSRPWAMTLLAHTDVEETVTASGILTATTVSAWAAERALVTAHEEAPGESAGLPSLRLDGDREADVVLPPLRAVVAALGLDGVLPVRDAAPGPSREDMPPLPDAWPAEEPGVLGPVPGDVWTWRPGAFGSAAVTWREYVAGRPETPDWLRTELRVADRFTNLPSRVGAEVKKWFLPWAMGMVSGTHPTDRVRHGIVETATQSGMVSRSMLSGWLSPPEPLRVVAPTSVGPAASFSLDDLTRFVADAARDLATGPPRPIGPAEVAGVHALLTDTLAQHGQNIGRIPSVHVARMIAQYALSGQWPRGPAGGAPRGGEVAGNRIVAGEPAGTSQAPAREELVRREPDAWGRETFLAFDYGADLAEALREVAATGDAAMTLVLRAERDADGTVDPVPEPAPWGAWLAEGRTPPVFAFLTLRGGEFIRYDAGAVVTMSTQEVAASLVGSLRQDRLRRPLVVFTMYHGTDPDGLANGRQRTAEVVEAMGELTGDPWPGFHHVSANPPIAEWEVADETRQGRGIALATWGEPFEEHGVLSLTDVMMTAYGRIVALPGDPSRLAELAEFAENGAPGLAGAPGLNSVVGPVVLVLDGHDGGGHVRVVLGSSRSVVELGGGRLGEMLLRSDQFRQLLRDSGRAVVVVARGAGTRVASGGAGYDLASALRHAGFYNDVYALAGDAQVAPDGLALSDDSRFELVSVLRTDDVRRQTLDDADGRPVATFLRYPGDERPLALARAWASRVTSASMSAYHGNAGLVPSPWDDRPFIVFTSGVVTRDDGEVLVASTVDLGRIVAHDPEVRAGLATGSGVVSISRGIDPPVLWLAVDGHLDTAGIAPEMLRGGHWRSQLTPAPGTTWDLAPDGRLTLSSQAGTPEFHRTGPPRPGPDDVLSYAMSNERLGTFGQYHPDDLAAMLGESRYAASTTELTRRVYWQQFLDDDSGEPVLGDWGPRVWLHGTHGSQEVFWYHLRTGRPDEVGDRFPATGEEAARLQFSSRLFRSVHPDPANPPELLLRVCEVGGAPRDGVSPARRFREEWSRLGAPPRVWSASDSVVSSTRGAFGTSADGVFDDGTGLDPIRLADLAANHLDPVTVSPADGDGFEAGVRRAARLVVRATAWRLRNGADLPVVTVRGGGFGWLRAAADAGVVFTEEATAEAARLTRLGLPVTPADLLVHRETMSFGYRAPSDGRAELAISVDFPQHELGMWALLDADVADVAEAFESLVPDEDDDVSMSSPRDSEGDVEWSEDASGEATPRPDPTERARLDEAVHRQARNDIVAGRVPVEFFVDGVPGGVGSDPRARIGLEVEGRVATREGVSDTDAYDAAAESLAIATRAEGLIDWLDGQDLPTGDQVEATDKWAMTGEVAHVNGVEFKAPVLTPADRPWRQVQTLLGLWDHTVEATTTGGHVNTSFAGHTEPVTYARIAQLVKAFEATLYRLGNVPGGAQHRDLRFVGPNPVPVDPFLVRTVEDVAALGLNKHDAVNYRHVRGDDDTDRLEFRFWSGSKEPAVWQVRTELSLAIQRAAENPANFARLSELAMDPDLLWHPGTEHLTDEVRWQRFQELLNLLDLAPAVRRQAVQLYAWTRPWQRTDQNDLSHRALSVAAWGDRVYFPVPGDSVADAFATVTSMPRFPGVHVVKATLDVDVQLWDGSAMDGYEQFAKTLHTRFENNTTAFVLLVPEAAVRPHPGTLSPAETVVEVTGSPVLVPAGETREHPDGRVFSAGGWILFNEAALNSGGGRIVDEDLAGAVDAAGFGHR